jgi:hypothetical protein
MLRADTVKARMKMDAGRGGRGGPASRPGFRAACAGILRETGGRGFYRGLGVTLVKAVPVNAEGIALWRFLQGKLGTP